MKLTLIDIVVYLLYLGFLGFTLMVGPHGSLPSAALFLSVVCALFWFVARWQLGDAFSVDARAHHLVTSGLYAKIQHPIYVFGTMAFLFVVLALQGWPALIIWAVVILIQVARIRRENRVLAEKFGAEYQAYRSQTWF